MRIAVEPGGCAGLLYEVSFDGVPAASDVIVDSDGVQVLLSPDSARYMNGAVIDFAENSLIVRNPNAASACSCGASFTSNADDSEEATSTAVR
jgi:iron-sulfur cluster assembly accessory protein